MDTFVTVYQILRDMNVAVSVKKVPNLDIKVNQLFEQETGKASSKLIYCNVEGKVVPAKGYPATFRDRIKSVIQETVLGQAPDAQLR